MSGHLNITIAPVPLLAPAAYHGASSFLAGEEGGHLCMCLV
jgi:hypothetical protein